MPDPIAATLKKLQRNRAAILISFLLLTLLGRIGYAVLQHCAGTAVDPTLFLPGSESNLTPEPAEQQTYLLLLAAALPVLYLSLSCLKRFRLPSVWPAAAWSIFGFCMLLWPTDEWLYMIALNSLNAPWKIGALAGLTVLAGTALFYFRGNWNRWWILAPLLAAAALLNFNFSIYLPGYLTEYFTHHFEVLCYPISQAALGRVPIHQYGFYPNFIAPLWSFLPLSTLSVNFLLAGLAWGCLAALLVALSYLTRNRIALFLGGVILIYLCAPVSPIANGDIFDPYFAYFPIRALFPVLHLALFLSFLRTEKRLKNAWYWLLGAFAGCGLFWNLDSGMVGVVCWTVFLALDGRLRHWKRPAGFMAGCLGACVTLWFYLGWLGGAPLSFAEIFRAPKIFAANGFFMIPLPDWPCAWGFFAAVYGIGLGLGIAGILPGATPTRRSRTMLFLSLLGCGLAGYYVGRSHNLALGTCMFPALLLLGMFLDDAARLFRLKPARPGALAVALPPLLLFAVFALNLLIFSPQVLFSTRFNLTNLAGNRASLFRPDAEFIRVRADGRSVNIFGPYQAFLFLESGCRADIGNSGENEIILREDLQRLLAALARSEAPLFLNQWSRFLPPEFLDRYYILQETSPNGVRYYEPRNRFRNVLPQNSKTSGR